MPPKKQTIPSYQIYKYAVIRLQNEEDDEERLFECIPDRWFVDETKTACFWPPKSGKSFTVRAVNCEKPDDSWNIYACIVISDGHLTYSSGFRVVQEKCNQKYNTSSADEQINAEKYRREHPVLALKGGNFEHIFTEPNSASKQQSAAKKDKNVKVSSKKADNGSVPDTRVELTVKSTTATDRETNFGEQNVVTMQQNERESDSNAIEGNSGIAWPENAANSIEFLTEPPSRVSSRSLSTGHISNSSRSHSAVSSFGRSVKSSSGRSGGSRSGRSCGSRSGRSDGSRSGRSGGSRSGRSGGSRSGRSGRSRSGRSGGSRSGRSGGSRSGRSVESRTGCTARSSPGRSGGPSYSRSGGSSSGGSSSRRSRGTRSDKARSDESLSVRLYSSRCHSINDQSRSSLSGGARSRSLSSRRHLSRLNHSKSISDRSSRSSSKSRSRARGNIHQHRSHAKSRNIRLKTATPDRKNKRHRSSTRESHSKRPRVLSPKNSRPAVVDRPSHPKHSSASTFKNSHRRDVETNQRPTNKKAKSIGEKNSSAKNKPTAEYTVHDLMKVVQKMSETIERNHQQLQENDRRLHRMEVTVNKTFVLVGDLNGNGDMLQDELLNDQGFDVPKLPIKSTAELILMKRKLKNENFRAFLLRHESQFCCPTKRSTDTSTISKYLMRFITLRVRSNITLKENGENGNTLFKDYHQIYLFLISVMKAGYKSAKRTISVDDAHTALRIVWGRSKQQYRESKGKSKRKLKRKSNSKRK